MRFTNRKSSAVDCKSFCLTFWLIRCWIVEWTRTVLTHCPGSWLALVRRWVVASARRSGSRTEKIRPSGTRIRDEELRVLRQGSAWMRLLSLKCLPLKLSTIEQCNRWSIREPWNYRHQIIVHAGDLNCLLSFYLWQSKRKLIMVVIF